VWFHPQENSVTNFITTVNVMCIGITFLSILRFFNPLSYHLHFLFHFLDRFWSYQDPILKMILAQRCLTQFPIKKLKRYHLNVALIVVVVRKLYQWQELFPQLFLVHHAHMQHIFQDLVRSFYLSISIWVIHDAKVKLGSQGLLETSPKSSCKHRSSIGYDPLGNAMQSHNLADKNSSYVWYLIHHTHGDKCELFVSMSTTTKIDLCLLSSATIQQ
jgi:hypothetical protein